jgi:hypothetical protein
MRIFHDIFGFTMQFCRSGKTGEILDVHAFNPADLWIVNALRIQRKILFLGVEVEMDSQLWCRCGHARAGGVLDGE